MKRKAIGVLVFCLALLGAIVAGYWDLLNSERLRIAEERAGDVVTQLSGLVEPEEAADDRAARGESGSEAQSVAGLDEALDQDGASDAAEGPAATGDEPAAAVEAETAVEETAAKVPASRPVPTTIVPAAPATGGAEDVPRKPQAVPADAPSAQPMPADEAVAGLAGDADPPAEAAAASEASGTTETDDADRAPEDAREYDAGVASSGRSEGDADGTGASAATPAAEEPLTPPRFDVLRVETDGSTVIAGRAPAGSTIALVGAGGPVATEAANAAGDFVIVLDTPLAPGDYQMRIAASLPDGRRVVSEETAIVSVPEAGSESELLAMVEAPDAASRLISVPSALPETQAGPQESGIASGDSLPAERPVDTASAEAGGELLLPPTDGQEAAAEDAGTLLELPQRVSTFFSRARALSLDAGSLDGGKAPAATIAIARDAESVADEGRALAEELPLAADPQEGGEGDARLTELVRETAETAEEVGKTAEAVDLARTADAADRLAGLAGEAETRLSSLGADGAVPSRPADADADVASTGEAGAAGTLSVEAVEIENDTIYIAGRAEPGSTVRIYLDNEYLADDKVAAGDRFLITTNASVARGDHLVRADQIDANGRVTARAEVPFFKPEGAMMSAIAPPPPEDSEGATGVEMLPATDFGAAVPADEDDGEGAEAAPGRAAEGDAAVTDDAVSDTRTAEKGSEATEAATPGAEAAARTANARRSSLSVVSNPSGDDAAPTGEGASSGPEAVPSAAPAPGVAAEGDGGSGDRSDPPAASSSADSGGMAVVATSEEGDEPDDAGSGDGAGSSSPSPAVESPSAAAPGGLPGSADAGADPTAAATASDGAAGPAAGGEAGAAASGDAGSAAIGSADPSTGSAQDFAPTGAPASGADAPASGTDIASAAADRAAPIEASPPAAEPFSAPGDAAPSDEAATAFRPAGPADDDGIAVIRQPSLELADSRVIIRKGDTLWEISRETYGRGSRYTVIYLANGDQIRNPDRIYPGQVFRLPDDLMDALDSSSRAN